MKIDITCDVHEFADAIECCAATRASGKCKNCLLYNPVCIMSGKTVVDACNFTIEPDKPETARRDLGNLRFGAQTGGDVV